MFSRAKSAELHFFRKNRIQINSIKYSEESINACRIKKASPQIADRPEKDSLWA